MTAGPETFAQKLDLALKALSMSRGRLAHEAGLDKSLVGRWVSGQVIPSAHDMERLTAAPALRSPGFSMLDWDRPLARFADRFGTLPVAALPTQAVAPGSLTFAFDVTGPARAETAKRGDEYGGLYRLYRASFV